jgi:hypothetical protein
MEKTPDHPIQEAIAGIFRKFRELGSVRQVLLWFRDEKIPIRAYSREPGKRKIVWNNPVYARIFSILKNPTDAGVFVWGRKHTRTSIVDGRARKTAGHNRPQELWEVTIPDHHEGQGHGCSPKQTGARQNYPLNNAFHARVLSSSACELQ